MCGRFAFYSPAEAVTRLFGAESATDMPPRFNIAPTQAVPVVRREEDGVRRMRALRWGLVPFWAKDPAVGNRMINARAETVATKPAFRQAYRKRRCLVIADGFYEWQKAREGKVPWYISQDSGEPFAMAGLWERWQDRDEQALETCTILTTEAGQSLQRIHHRMPVILDPEGVEYWLSPDLPGGALETLVEAARRAPLKAVEVSRRVNNPANEGPELIAPVDDQASA